MATIIGMLRETSLHSQLKQLYALPGDLLEEKVGSSVIDIVRGELLIEIQTGNFSALRGKLGSLIDTHPMRIIYPIAVHKTILRIASNGELISKRKSPKTGRVEMVYAELIRVAGYVKHSNFSLEVAFIEEEVVWKDDGKGSWRRSGWSIDDRRLTRFVGSQILAWPVDYSNMIPAGMGDTFTSGDLARHLHLRKSLAGKMIYSLRAMDLIQMVGKSGRYNLYSCCF
jgi:hypothetical protein